MKSLIAGAKSHLQPYSIIRKRKTTVSHMFAAALAEVEEFSVEAVQDQLVALGQDPSLPVCVFCDREATTWDHLFPTVRQGEYSGHGHIVANLVPCCSGCNSAKGGMDWRAFVRARCTEPDRRVSRLAQISAIVESRKETQEGVSARDPEAYREYLEIRATIFELMIRADALAIKLRRT